MGWGIEGECLRYIGFHCSTVDQFLNAVLFMIRTMLMFLKIKQRNQFLDIFLSSLDLLCSNQERVQVLLDHVFA